MAVISLNIQTVDRNGLNNPTSQAVGAADTAEFVNDGETWLRVTWGGTGGNLAFVTPAIVGSNPTLAVADHVVAISAGENKLLGPFPGNLYNDASGKVTLDPDQACNVTAFTLTKS